MRYTDWVFGKLSNVSDLGTSYDINNTASILYIGEAYRSYIFCGMYFYPEIKIVGGSNIVIPEGYHAGVGQIRGRNVSYDRQEISHNKGLNERLTNLCNKSVGKIRYGKVNLPKDAYFAIYNLNDRNNIILIHTE
jgi:hypothetical protein